MISAMIALTAVIGSSGTAREQDGQRVTIADPEMGRSCSARRASPVDLQALAADPRAYDDKCLRVKGLWIDPALYSGLEGYYLAGPGIGPPATTSGGKHRIGLYISDDMRQRAGHMQAAEAEVIGVAGVCEDLSNVSDTVFTMAIGYCHYAGGAYVNSSEISFRRVPLIRQVGETAREKLRDLAPPPKGWAHLGEVEALAQRWLRDIRTSNVDDFLALHAVNASEVDLDDKESVFNQVFRAKNSPFAPFRGASSTPQMAIFVFQRSQDPGAKPMPPSDYVATVCFCRENDCSARWPISIADASNAMGRPFICGQFFAETENGKTERYARAEIDWRNLQEPALSNAR
jgi:hypothetical protein